LCHKMRHLIVEYPYVPCLNIIHFTECFLNVDTEFTL
jgi:hypothetical protein